MKLLDTFNNKARPNMESQPRNGQAKMVTGTLVLSTFSAVCGTSLVFGWCTGVINNPSENIKQFFNEIKQKRDGSEFSKNALKWYWSICVAIWALVAPLGCFLGAAVAKKFGRKRTMLANNLLLVIGGLFQSCSKLANSYEMFLLGRLITGINNGVGTAVCPMYLAEIAPKEIRGGIGVTFQLTCVFGILIAQIFGFQSILGGPEYWPQLFNLVLLFGLIQVILLPICPASPRYLLIEQRDRDGCREALSRLRGKDAFIEEEMEEIIEEDRKDKSEPPVSYMDLIKIGKLRRPLIVSCAMAMSQQLSGINAINYYSAPIFKAALPKDTMKKNEDLPNYLVAGTGVINFLATVVSLFTIDWIGRRASHLIGLVGMAIAALSVGLLLSDLPTSKGQVCHGIDVSNVGVYIAIVFIFVYIISVSIGPGPIPWLITPELFSSGSRAKALSIANTVNWLCNFSIALGFPPLIEALCGWVFMIFFGFLVFFTTFLYFKLPEVKGKAVNEIVHMFALMSQSLAQSFMASERQPLIKQEARNTDNPTNFESSYI